MGSETLNGYSSTGITLTEYGAFNAPFTITHNGTIKGDHDGVYAARYFYVSTLRNAGTIETQLPGVDIRGVAGVVLNTGSIITSGIYYGVFLNSGGTVANSGRSALIYSDITGVRGNFATLLNTGTIIGKNEYGVAIPGLYLTDQGGYVVNAASYALIYGSEAGVFLPGSAATVTNSGTITGKNSGVLVAGPDEVIANNGTQALIYGGRVGIDDIEGVSDTITNAGTIFGAVDEGIFLDFGGTVSNSGTIGGYYAIYNEYGSLTLNALAGGVFDGAVMDQAGGGVLNLAGMSAGMLDMGGSFSGFSSINFGPAAWTLEGTAGELANGETITGFTAGDTIDLTGFAATAASYISGTGLVLSNATASETLHFIGGAGLFNITGDGNGGTDIAFGTHTLATASATGITLTAGGPDINPFTVTQTGTIASSGYGVYSALSAAYLLNQGSITSPGDDTVLLTHGGTVVNSGTIGNSGPVFAGLPTRAGVEIRSAAGTVLNTGSIIDSAEFGVYLKSGGAVTNLGGSAFISGHLDGVGIQGSGTVINTGTIIGSTANGVVIENGLAVLANTAASAVIYGAIDGAVILGTDAVGTVINSGTIIGHGSYGLRLDEGGTVTNSGTITGKLDAIDVANGFTLNVLAGGVFYGAVLDKSGGGVLDLGGSVAGTLDMGESFSGFSTLNFGPAAWTLEGTAGELANGQTITGFSVGDVIDLTGFAATSSSYTAGTGLVLSNATASETLGFTGGDPSFVVSGDGNGGTDIFGVTHTLATTSTLGITLTATGPYVSPFTVTQTGTIASTYGVYSALSAAYLLNAGTITGASGDAVFLTQSGTVVNSGILANEGPFQISEQTRSGVDIQGTGTVFNTGSITSGAEFGVYVQTGVVNNTGRSALISGYRIGVADENGVTVSNAGTIIGERIDGVQLADSGGFVANTASYALIYGAQYGVTTDPKNGLGTVINSGTIIGEAVDGVRLNLGGAVTNSGSGVISGGETGVDDNHTWIRVYNSGTIAGSAAYGVYLRDQSTLVNSGTISGGVAAVRFGGSGDARVVVETGAVFIGAVEAAGTGNTLEFAGTGSTIASIGSAFTGFQTVAFDPGAAWTIGGDAAELTALATITGFTVGDEIDLTGFAATGASYTAGVGLLLTSAASSVLLSISGGEFAISGDGSGGTDIQFGTRSLATYTATGITLTAAGPYLSPFTVTQTGTVESGSTGITAALPAAYLLNDGTVSGGATGVAFEQGGTLDNGATGAVISGGNDGVAVYYPAGTITNAGTITGAGQYGVYLQAGGTVTNSGTGAVIYGGRDGVFVKYDDPGTLTNAGTIEGASVDGVYLGDGGSLSNTGTITGGDYGVYVADAAATITNAGTIAGPVAMDFTGINGARVVAQAGAVFIGAVEAAGTGNILELASVASAATLDMGGSFSGFDSISFDSAGWTLGGSNAELANGETIDGFAVGDTLILEGFTATSQTYVSGTGLELGDAADANVTLDIVGDFQTSDFTVDDVAGGTAIYADTGVPCFCAGTRILTARGEVAVEALAIGDELVMARAGGPATRKIIWIGQRRMDIARHREPDLARPIRILAGAFGPGKPARDLRVSPHHAIYAEGNLFEARALVNGVTVLREQNTRHVRYFHIELETHDILLAENLPTESYLDNNNRSLFDNGGEVIELHPSFRSEDHGGFCVPLVLAGAALVRAKAALLNRAAELGHRITHDDDLHIIADGKRIEPRQFDRMRLVFVIPPGCAGIRMHSKNFVPAQCDATSEDRRELGVCVARIQCDGAALPLDDDALFGDGWHGMESTPNGGSWRWTTGNTPLPPHSQLIMLELAGQGYYWTKDEAAAPKSTVAPACIGQRF